MEKDIQRINVYTAIEQMKRLSQEGETFSLSFRKYDRQRHSGGDTVRLNHARLRPKASDEESENATDKLFLVDTDTGRAINCWQILVTSFNGIKTYV